MSGLVRWWCNPLGAGGLLGAQVERGEHPARRCPRAGRAVRAAPRPLRPGPRRRREPRWRRARRAPRAASRCSAGTAAPPVRISRAICSTNTQRASCRSFDRSDRRGRVRRVGHHRHVTAGRTAPAGSAASGLCRSPRRRPASRRRGSERHLIEVAAAHLRQQPLHVRVGRVEHRAGVQALVVGGQRQRARLGAGQRLPLVVDQQPHVGVHAQGAVERALVDLLPERPHVVGLSNT
jgi:hypothetical protein